MLSILYNSPYRDHDLAIQLKEVGLRINFNESSESVDEEKYLQDVAEEVHNMFKKVSETHPLALGLASAPCRKEHCLKCSGTGCLDKPIAIYKDRHMHRLHRPNIKTNGISRRAYASGKSCFCRDIRNFSILECPLAHHARLAGLTFSFATCVQSIQEESSNVLVLEFLLLPGRYDIESIRLFTRSLLTKIKELLPYYMVAVEDFPGEELFPKNYDSLEYDEIDHVQVDDNTLSLPVTCDDDEICYLDNEEEVIDFFLPINLTCEGSSDDEENKHDALVFWRNDVETCYGVDERIKLVFKHVPMGHYDVELVQFWAPRRIAGKSFLTIYDHPFVIRKYIRKVTCLYRIECMRRKTYVDKEGSNEEQLGPVGRAFKNGVVECSPDVKLYTIKEFPLRDHAVLWGIKGAMFLPVFELNGKDTVGVLEILYLNQWELGTYLNNLAMELKKMGLRIDYLHPQPGASFGVVGQSNSLAELENICEAVSMRYPLQFARMLTPSLTDYCHNNSSQEYISHIWSRRFRKYEVDIFLVPCSFHQLLDKNGVAGKALASRRSCFCMNIGNWGIKDDFLSHYVELIGCNFSVAICMENTRVVDASCVLEFFLLPGDYSNAYIGGLLGSLLRTVKEHLPPNFKILSEDVPGEPFFLEIEKIIESESKAIISGVHVAAGRETNPLVPQENNFDIQIADYLENTSGFHIVDGTEAIQGEIVYGMVVADGTEATPFPQWENICEMNATDGIETTTPIHQEENIYEMHVVDSIEITPFPQGENIHEIHAADGIEATHVHQGENNHNTQQSSSKMEGNKFHVTLNQLKLQFGNTLDEAAANLGVSRSTLKRIRKIHGIRRWPSHKKNKVNPALYMKQNPRDAPPIVSSEADSTRSVLPMQPCNRSAHQLQTDQHQEILYRDHEVDKIVTIKASYGHRKIIKFKLNTKSTLQDLQEQVTKRLKWEAGMFEIEYQDEAKDWVTIIIDEDLKDCLQASIDRGDSTISMSINLRLD